MDTKYHGVVYHKSFGGYAARVAHKNKFYWLKTWATAYEAAQVRDVAATWLRDPKTKLNNLPDKGLPEGVTEALIARWLVDAGVPLRVIVYRIPLPVLAEVGITEYQLLQAGVSSARILRFTNATN